MKKKEKKKEKEEGANFFLCEVAFRERAKY
jgi:hypothetical protein